MFSLKGSSQDKTGRPTPPQVAPPLTPPQKQALRAIQSRSEQRAKPDALRMAQIARRIYANLLAERPDEGLRSKLGKELDAVVLELLHIKGDSIGESVRILTPEQKRLLQEEMLKADAPADLMEVMARTFAFEDK